MNATLPYYGTFLLTSIYLSKSTPAIKPEPQEARIAPLVESTLRRNGSDPLIKVEAESNDAARVVSCQLEQDASSGG